MKLLRHIIAYTALFGLVATFAAPRILPNSSAQAARPVQHSKLHPMLRKDTSCTPVRVVVWAGSRVHVQCSASVGGITYFATSAKSPSVNQVLSLLETAQVAGRTLSITYDSSDVSGASFGCAASDCRTIQAVGFSQ